MFLLILTLFTQLFATAVQAQGFVESNQISDFKLILESASQFRPNAQPASTGVFGSLIGVSVDEVVLPTKNPYIEYHFGGRDAERLQFESLHWQKGTSLPLDFGAALGQDSLHGITTWHTFLQWTLYESFKVPSVCARVFYNQIYNFDGLNASTSGVELSGGYSFLGIFSVYMTAGVHSHRQRFNALVRSESLSLVSNYSEIQKADKLHSHMRYGGKVRLYFPFIHIQVEDQYQVRNDIQRSPTFSINIGY